jgi:hypothetical protein
MIKFTGTAEDGTRVVGLGLEDMNWVKLKQDKPILIKFKDLNLSYPVEVLIFASEHPQSEKGMQELLAKLQRTSPQSIHGERDPYEHAGAAEDEIKKIHALLDDCGLARHGLTAFERLEGYLELIDSRDAVLPKVQEQAAVIVETFAKMVRHSASTRGEIASDPAVYEAFQAYKLCLITRDNTLRERYEDAIEAVLKRAYSRG